MTHGSIHPSELFMDTPVINFKQVECSIFFGFYILFCFILREQTNDTIVLSWGVCQRVCETRHFALQTHGCTHPSLILHMGVHLGPGPENFLLKFDQVSVCGPQIFHFVKVQAKEECGNRFDIVARHCIGHLGHVPVGQLSTSRHGSSEGGNAQRGSRAEMEY